MNLNKIKKQLEEINKIKSQKKIENLSLSELQKFPMVNTILELKFNDNFFLCLT